MIRTRSLPQQVVPFTVKLIRYKKFSQFNNTIRLTDRTRWSNIYINRFIDPHVNCMSKSLLAAACVISGNDATCKNKKQASTYSIFIPSYWKQSFFCAVELQIFINEYQTYLVLSILYSLIQIIFLQLNIHQHHIYIFEQSCQTSYKFNSD